MGIFNFFKKDSNRAHRSWAVVEVTDADFKTQVLQRSHKTPVLVDFWAAWCGPCRALGPILEDLAQDAISQFILAKLDTDRNQQTARKYQIQSIPAVKMFRNGQVVDEFMGARPGVLVKRFVDKTLQQEAPSPQITGSPDPARRLAQARQHLQKGRSFEAFVLLDNFPASPENDEARQLLPLATFLFDLDLGDLTGGDEELLKAYETLGRTLRKRQYDAALGQLEEIASLSEDNAAVDLAELAEGIKALRDSR